MPRKAKQEPATAVHNRIRALRFHADEMTQQELALSVGVTRQTINAIEAGKYAPSLEVAFKIAHAFQAPLEQVFSYHPAGAEDDTGRGADEHAGSDPGSA